MRYKVGDRVKIQSLDWYNRHTNGTEVDCGGVPFTSNMKKFCSRVMTISFVCTDCYTMEEDLENYYTDEMIEGLVEELVTLNGKEVLLKLADIELPSGTTNIWECNQRKEDCLGEEEKGVSEDL